MAEECKKKIEQILNNYHIKNTATNLNSIIKVLLDGKKEDIYKKIIELANCCIITDENKESFTSEILIYKNIIAPPPSDFRHNLFLRIKIYKNVSK